MQRATVVAAFLLMTAMAGAAGRYAPEAAKREAASDFIEKPGTPWRGSPGITETVARIMQPQTHAGPSSEAGKESEEEGERRRPPRQENPESPLVAAWPSASPDSSTASGFDALMSLGSGFKVMSFYDAGSIPPDTIGAVGPTQILIVVNGRVRVLSRSGEIGDLDIPLDLFFSPANHGLHTWDPQVKYDRLSGRFFITALTNGLPNYIVIAVSSGSTITDRSSFTFFSFRQDEPLPAGHADGWADFDGLGVDRRSLYIAVDIGSDGPDVQFLASDGFVVDKADLLAGMLTVTAFRDLYPGGNHNGLDDPRGVSNDDPNSTEGYFIATDVKTYGRLILRRVTYPGGIPAISGNIFLNVPSTVQPMYAHHKGMVDDPVVLDDRLYTAIIRTNKLTGVRSLWTAHNIQVNASGVADNSGLRDGVRWYQIGNLSGTPTLVQAGTLFDPTPDQPRFFYIPSITQSGQGHAVLGFSTSGVFFYIDAGVAGRLSSDPLGTMGPFALLTASDTPYTYYNGVGGIEKWGDYSETLVDPNDDMTFWTFQEYCDAYNSWGIWVSEVNAPPPATPTTVSPASFCPGLASAQVTVTGVSQAGSGFFDPGPDTGGPGFLNHIAGSVTGGVTVSGAIFDSPTQVRLNLSTISASSGIQDITITNPDGQSATGSGLLTILPRPTPPAAGNNGPICEGAALQLTSSSIPGATYHWTGPGGFSSNQQNPSLAGATPSLSGVYSVTVTTPGGCESLAGTTLVSIVADSAPCDDGDACTAGESCNAGLCQGGASTDGDGDAHCGGNDCNDANPLVWLSPVEVINLTLTAAGPTQLSWDSQSAIAGPQTSYDLASGSLGPGSGIFFTEATCLQSDLPETYSDERPDPAVGRGFWYLARARNVCGIGTYGSPGRDGSIPNCP